METCKKQKIVTNDACFCAATMLASILNFLGARMAAINLFQVHFDKP